MMNVLGIVFAIVFPIAAVAAIVYEVACRGVSRWVKARAGMFGRLAAWRRMSAAEKAARKELEDEMERQRQEEIRAEREAEENRRQNARAVQELVHPETGTRWRLARVAPSEMVYVQHLDEGWWVTVTAWKRTWGCNEITENHIKGKSRKTGSQDHPTGWYWYGKQGWGVQLDINFISGNWSVNGQVASPVASETESTSVPGIDPEPPEEPKKKGFLNEVRPEPEEKGEPKRPDRLEMLE